MRGKVVQAFDQAGVVTSDEYDFKGNLRRGQRQLAADYKTTLNWDAAVPLEAETFTSRTRHDALNRPIQLIAPHSDQPNTKVNVIQPIYNEANLLEQVHAWLNQNAEPVDLLDSNTANLHAVTDIDYDAKGQRTRIDYGNGTRTTYAYDPLTLRLIHLLTRRDTAAFPDDCPQPPPAGWPGCQVQNLHYTYDPAGNITHIRDDAQQTIYFQNKRVEPSAEYTYDALYRLIEATGREHLGQVGGSPIPHSHDDAPRVGVLHPNAGDAMGRYLEQYVYDAVGNFLQMIHHGSDPAHSGWTRAYAYNEASLIESTKQSNRLSSTQVGNGINAAPEPYTYDAHGNMVRMPHLGGGAAGPNMYWDYKDQLQTVDLGGGGTAYYVYDASGQRVRKVIHRQNGTKQKERIYLGGFELYREYNGGASQVDLERETLHVMDDKQRIALVETKTISDSSFIPQPSSLTRYQFGNHLGSASLELDDQAQIISYEEYTPYGSTSYQAVRSQTEAPKRYRYTGQERDEETGFSYHGARYYAPWLGRWTSTDKAGLVDGPNLYPYVNNNPIKSVDPDGKQTTDVVAEMIAKAFIWAFRASAQAIKSVEEFEEFYKEAIKASVEKLYKEAIKTSVEEFYKDLNTVQEEASKIVDLLNAGTQHLSDAEKKEITAKLNNTNSWKDKLLADLVLNELGKRGPHLESLPVGTKEFEIGGRTKQNLTHPKHRSDFYESGNIKLNHPQGHHANDIFAKRGEPVLSPVTGRIVAIYHDGTKKEDGTPVQAGNQVRVQRGNFLFHMSHEDTIGDFKVGDIVLAGTQVGTVGDTGSAKGTHTHIHFEIGKGSSKNEIDPFQYLMEHITPAPPTQALAPPTVRGAMNPRIFYCEIYK
jgi:RHS repeat-associated protein